MAEPHTLHDADGTPIARYLRIDGGRRPAVDVLDLAVPVERALPRVREAFAGMRVAGPRALGEALLETGGRRIRHAHEYVHDLEVVPPEPPGLHPLDRGPDELLPVYDAAFPPGHPDRVARPDRHLAGILAGKLGPVLDGSAIALHQDQVIGAILVARSDDGPWVMEVFRDPRYRGTGRALIERALARTEGSLGLTVTDGNPAERLYRRLGFRKVRTLMSVDL